MREALAMCEDNQVQRQCSPGYIRAPSTELQMNGTHVTALNLVRALNNGVNDWQMSWGLVQLRDIASGMASGLIGQHRSMLNGRSRGEVTSNTWQHHTVRHLTLIVQSLWIRMKAELTNSTCWKYELPDSYKVFNFSAFFPFSLLK